MAQGSPVNWKGGKAQQKTGEEKTKERAIRETSKAEERGRGYGQKTELTKIKNIFLITTKNKDLGRQEKMTRLLKTIRNRNMIIRPSNNVIRNLKNK